jgi:hypothetical protein
MQTTVGKLIELLSDYSKDSLITDEQLNPFIHIVNTNTDNIVILSTKKPIAYCTRTGGYVYPTSVDGYFGFSVELDEDVYEFETTPLDPKFVFDDVNNRVVTANDEINIFYTDTLTCSNDVIQGVVDIMNKTTQEHPINSEGEIDNYLLDAPCTTEDKEHICEALYLYYTQNK